GLIGSMRTELILTPLRELTTGQ
ncbi:MAG: hypothetical protein JWO52_5296, partial [Gammaproteobacteria bacterium]|nr:hypothetical protein [Gammaproteobacteria bacterium]